MKAFCCEFAGRWLLPLVILLGMSAASAAADKALKGVALVIGNSAYEHLTPLANPENDAKAVEDLLDDLGFDTYRTTDADAERLKRDLERFVEDAARADVAILYYAGHGIEAGGENFLVPVDADLSALEAAGDRLVPVSGFIERLRATVPVAILMLDACRNNPFPAGSMVRLDAGAQPAAMGESGLGETRGGARMVKPRSGVESYGTVIAFAAEPGKPALDGEPGANSPYAAAVLRHLDAMAGEEFGTVMRMVGEEVYLKTAGKQHPWVNESLRRLLYFGQAPAPLQGDEGAIRNERRGLLLTIAALPDARRRQVELAAQAGGVPLDAVYGMLKALGSDIPDDPSKLGELLRTEAERFAKVLAERQIIASPDSEIVRLSALADKAEGEGLFAEAGELRERAKARCLEIEPTLEKGEAALRRRFIEGAAVFARSAETRAVAFDHLGAAADYAEAFRRAEGRDDRLAWEYKLREMISLADHGAYKGDNAALERAIAAGAQALRLAEAQGDPNRIAATRIDLANAMSVLGERESGTARLEESIQVYRLVLELRRREEAPLEWALAQNNLGNSLWRLGLRQGGTSSLEEAAGAYRAALQERTRERVPLDWAGTQNNLGNVLSALGEREGGEARLQEAVAAYRAALQEYTRERVPLLWAVAQNNLGSTLLRIGERERGAATLDEAVAAFRAALEERPRERLPVDWAATQYNLGIVLHMIGDRRDDVQTLEASVAAFRSALEERTRERMPLDWSNTQSGLGAVLFQLANREEGAARLKEAIVALRAALEEGTRERMPVDWARTQDNLGLALWELGEREDDIRARMDAIDAWRAALGDLTRERAPHDWAATRNHLGRSLIDLGWRMKQRPMVQEGRDAMVAVRDYYRETGNSRFDDYFGKWLKAADLALADLPGQ